MSTLAAETPAMSGQADSHSCTLCGQPLARPLADRGQGPPFCCPGCRFVHELLMGPAAIHPDARSAQLYRNWAAAGLLPWSAGQPGPLAATGPEINDPGLEINLTINGMWCAACACFIRELLLRLPGVLSAEVLFLEDWVRLRYLPHRITPKEIVARLGRFGYHARPTTAEAEPELLEERGERLRLGVAAILTMNVMMVSFALYGGFVHTLEPQASQFFALLLLAMATPVLLYSGWPILVRGWHGLCQGRPTMDTLIALGSLAAYGYSLLRMHSPTLHLYFDTAAMLITLVLLGREVEGRVRRRLLARLGQDQRLTGGKARLLRQGREEWLAASAVQVGEQVVVRAGERVPVDGRVVHGHGAVDESLLSGESRPVSKGVDDNLLAGTSLMAGEVRLTATRVAGESALSRMIALTREALAAKHPGEQFADRLTRWFVPLVLCLAAATFLVLLFRGSSTEAALLRALTVLVMACPCALGIATPLAKVAVMAAGRGQGILIRDAAAFEQARGLDTLVLDKTGTVTQGGFTLLELLAPGHDQGQVLRRLAAVEAGADHFLAREIRRQAGKGEGEPVVAEEVTSHAGLGVSGRVAGEEEETVVGSRELLTKLGMTVPPQFAQRAAEAEARGRSVVFAAWQGEVRALLVFGDSLRPGARQLVAGLQARGIEVWLASGDSTATTAAVAGQLGITRFSGQARPEEKVALVSRLQAQGRRVGMAGDGVNDAAALARAEVGFAMGSHPDRIMEEAAAVTLFGSSPERLLAVLALSARMAHAIRQNLALAFLYNGIGLPLAMLGLLNPLLAVLAMVGSSLMVIANTLRVVRLADSELTESPQEHGIRQHPSPTIGDTACIPP